MFSATRSALVVCTKLIHKSNTYAGPKLLPSAINPQRCPKRALRLLQSSILVRGKLHGHNPPQRLSALRK